jgi:hypothetical protein
LRRRGVDLHCAESSQERSCSQQREQHHSRCDPFLAVERQIHSADCESRKLRVFAPSREPSIVAPRLVWILAIGLRGLKPTAIASCSRYAAKTKQSGSDFGPRCYGSFPFLAATVPAGCRHWRDAR